MQLSWQSCAFHFRIPPWSEKQMSEVVPEEEWKQYRGVRVALSWLSPPAWPEKERTWTQDTGTAEWASPSANWPKKKVISNNLFIGRLCLREEGGMYWVGGKWVDTGTHKYAGKILRTCSLRISHVRLPEAARLRAAHASRLSAVTKVHTHMWGATDQKGRRWESNRPRWR